MIAVQLLTLILILIGCSWCLGYRAGKRVYKKCSLLVNQEGLEVSVPAETVMEGEVVLLKGAIRFSGDNRISKVYEVPDAKTAQKAPQGP